MLKFSFLLVCIINISVFHNKYIMYSIILTPRCVCVWSVSGWSWMGQEECSPNRAHAQSAVCSHSHHPHICSEPEGVCQRPKTLSLSSL